MSVSPAIRNVTIVVLAIVVALAALGYYLFRPLSAIPTPADFECYRLGQGAYVPLDVPPQAFGVGLTYAGHIEETASEYDPSRAPPVFTKSAGAVVRSGANVVRPTSETLIETADIFEPGLGDALRSDYSELPALLDYEAEMGFVLLDDVDPSELEDPEFAPRLGFFIANDLSARTLAILGEGRPNRHAYWGVSKSFPGFLPIADKAWVPEKSVPRGSPCVEIETIINGEVRQRDSTESLIYTPAQMLAFIHDAFPDAPLAKGTIVLTGTPGGVAMTTPRWLARLANLVGLSRFTKLSAKLDSDEAAFLQVADEVTVRGQGLGKVTVTVTE